MVYLSKSKYCGLWQCPKIAWMKKYKPEELTLDKSVLSRMEVGNEVGDLAMGLFGDYVEVTALLHCTPEPIFLPPCRHSDKEYWLISRHSFFVYPQLFIELFNLGAVFFYLLAVAFLLCKLRLQLGFFFGQL